MLVGILSLSACGGSASKVRSVPAHTSTAAEVRESDERASHLEEKVKAEEQAKYGPEETKEKEREKNLETLLTHRHAVGMTEDTLRRKLGSPEHLQEIEGTNFWYYKYELSIDEEVEYQVVIIDGIVHSVNRYS